VGNDRVGQGVHADRTLLLALYDELKCLLQESPVFVVEWDDALLVEEVH
jgi:hypothetical protein